MSELQIYQNEDGSLQLNVSHKMKNAARPSNC